MNCQVIVPISKYYGDDTYLEVGTKTQKMFLLVQVENDKVVNVDCGYRNLKEILETAKAVADRLGEVISPKHDTILPPMKCPW